uniref:deoxynucleoside triphosphate triphosphohydrolase SAMHD1 isoform X1 n=1 Tax=Ciona intestinalis TaxID=7719 RepID=UPI0002B8DBCE|nr:deoxynucleoside triphosphate triphosphohydrolase SAMHD1 isoform X1 [Ciona intestinalis]|eukprot:XP_009860481.1 deoxynucleoside triphosphate triphosphohydrolase SAMHD1 isoform X1 [Ciona intestinalis]
MPSPEEIEAQSKVFNDPIHGHIKLHPLLVKFIDTPQFQRLRNIKQLGGNYFVYPGASHNRFEHCIGTCHLAGELVKLLKRKQSDLNIDDKDVLCVQIAGLCHDLGHGPFSHMFDLKFLPLFRKSNDPEWTHEVGSRDMLRYMINDNDLQKEANRYGLDIRPDVTGSDFQFITEMITGPSGKEYVGKDKKKHFLYQIVSNEINKVDVDKWDYLARDCHHLGLKNSFDHIRFMHHLKVLEVDGVPQICVRDKERHNLYELFHVRSLLHIKAYQHTLSTITETMICDAMELANDHVKYCGKDGKEYTIAECVNEPSAFIKLTDHVFHEILHSKNNCHADMQKAKEILKRIQKRNLYRCIGTKKLTGTSKQQKENEKKIKEEFKEKRGHHVNVKRYDYGMKEKNPCEAFMFYSKTSNKPFQMKKEEVSKLLPDVFQDCEFQVFCKDPEKLEAEKLHFDEWWEKNRSEIQPENSKS